MKPTSHGYKGWKSSVAVLAGLLFLEISNVEMAAAPLSGAASLLNTNGSGDIGSDGNVSLAADGQAGVVAVWSSTEAVGGSGGDNDILVARSSDGGATWSMPALLNSNGDVDTAADLAPAVASDPSGNLVAVWQSNEDFGGAGTDPDVFVSRSADHGVTWSTRAVLNSNAGSNSGGGFKEPKVATDGSGVWIACWTSTDDAGLGIGTDQDVLYAISSDEGASWSSAALLNSDGASDSSKVDFNPDVSANENGTWVVAWASDDEQSNIEVAFSTNGGQSWSGQQGLHSPALGSGQDFQPDVHVNVQDQVMVVWESGVDLGGAIDEDQDILFSLSDDGGQSWSGPAAVNTDAGETEALDATPSVSSDECGHWVVAWSSEKAHYAELGVDADIVAAHYEVGAASWSPPLPVAVHADQDTGTDLKPEVLINVLGNVVIAWDSNEDFAGAGTDRDLVHVTVPKAVFWDGPEVLNGSAAGDGATPDRDAEIASDGNGALVAVWTAGNPSGGFLSDILFSRSTDEGENWSSPVRLNANLLTDTNADAGVAFMGGDDWAVLWTSNENVGGTLGTDQDLLVTRSTDGGATWSTPVGLDPNAASDGNAADFDGSIASDGAGNLIAVWNTDLFGGDNDIAYSRSSDGGVTWTAAAAMNPGAMVDMDDEFDSTIATGGNGTWIAAWFSNNDTGGIGGTLLTDDDLIYRRSTDNGMTWSLGALLNTNGDIDNALADDMRPSLASDGQGKWVAAWHLEGYSFEQTPLDETDTLVARSIDDGLSWSTPVALHTRKDETVAELWPRVVTTGNGLWVVAWPALDFVLGGQELTGGLPDDLEILQVMSCDDGLSWTSPALLNENGLVDSGRDDSIVLARGSEARLLAVWTSTENLGGVIGTDRDLLVARLHHPDHFRRWLHRSLGCTVFDPADEATIWGPEADPDGDGMVNLEEYYMGLDPVLGNLPVTTSVQKIPVDIVELQFRRADDDYLVADCRIEWSEDFQNWKSSGEMHSNGAVVTLTDQVPIDHGSYLTMRVRTVITGLPALYFRVVIELK